MASEVTFSKLAHEITQVSYRDLHALLDSMTELNSDETKAQLIDFSASLRHRLIRLLVATRWHMEYSSYHLSAHSLNSIVTNRSANLTSVADTLFAVSATARSAAASASAVAYAGEILGSGISPFRLPRIIEDAIGVDTLARGEKRTDPDEPSDIGLQPPVKMGSRRAVSETEAEMRVRLETKHAVRVGLPDGISVISWSAEPEHVGVRIGLRNAWYADVLLDNPDISKANLRLLDFKILIRAHADAVGPIRSSTEDNTFMPVSTTTHRELLLLFDDRVSWAVKDAVDEGANARAKAGLHCLCMGLSRDVCTALAMRFLREQAVALTRHRAWRSCKPVLHGVGYKEGPEVPLVLEYWKESSFKAKLSIQVPDDDGYIKSDSPSAKGLPHEVVNLSHEPELPAVCQDVILDLQELNVESLLLVCARRRATYILARIYEEIKSKTSAVSRCVLATHSDGVETMAIEIAKTGFGLVLVMSLKSGGFAVRLRSRSNIPGVERHSAWGYLQRAVWKGEKHFSDKVPGIVKAVQKIVYLLVRVQKDFFFETLVASADESTLLNWPPGPSSVECPQNETCKKFNIKPPFIGVDESKFLSAYSWIDYNDNSVSNSFELKKRVRKSPVNYYFTSDSLLFVQGKQTAPGLLKIDEYDLRPRASISAQWTELRHANGLRFRRDHLLRELEYLRLLTSRDADPGLKSSGRTSVEAARMKSLRASEAFLVLKGTKRWQVELKLRENLFDDPDSAGVVVGKSGVTYKGGKNPTLTFAYSDHNSKALSDFRHDYQSVVRVANIVQALESRKSSFLNLVKRTPRFVMIEAYELICTIYWTQPAKTHQVEAVYKMNNEPVKFCVGLLKQVGDFLDLSREDGNRGFFNALLEQMLPVMLGIEALCVAGIVHIYRIRSALFVQLRIAAAGNALHVVDIDMRQVIPGTIVVSDRGLLEQMKVEQPVGAGSDSTGTAIKAANIASTTGNGASSGGTKQANRSGAVPIAEWQASVADMETKGGKLTSGGVLIAAKSLVYFMRRLTGRLRGNV